MLFQRLTRLSCRSVSDDSVPWRHSPAILGEYIWYLIPRVCLWSNPYFSWADGECFLCSEELRQIYSEISFIVKCFVPQKSKAYKELLVSCTNGNGFIGQTRHPPVFRTFWRQKFETLRVLIPLTDEASPAEAAMHLKSLSGVPETYFTSFSKWNADAEKREKLRSGRTWFERDMVRWQFEDMVRSDSQWGHGSKRENGWTRYGSKV